VAGVTPVSCLCQSYRGHAAFVKASVGGFRRLRRLGPPRVKLPVGCWHSRPFGRSRPLWPNAVVIPGTSAGRWLCPWPTQIVIPTTLAPDTGEVSWVSMGLRWVLFLAEVDLHPSKSQDLLSSLLVADLEVEPHGVLPAISGRAGSRTEPAGGFLMATSWHPAPHDLFSRGLDLGTTCPHAAVSRPIGSGPLIFCDNHGGCPLLALTQRMTVEAVASTSWVRCATDPPALAFSLLNRGPFVERVTGHPLLFFLQCPLASEFFSSQASPKQI
jgi:hypothetical protein